jgi:GT2 family glycosyltransferase
VPEVAAVVLNFNGRGLLDDCLSSLRQQSAPVAIVVADNGSTDGSLDYVRARHPDARALDLGGNLGFALGYNRALEAVEAEWLLLVNNDAALAPDWVAQALAYAAAHPRAAILGGKLLFAGPGRVIQAAGARFTDAGTAFEIGWGEPDEGQYDQPGPVGAIPGAALLARQAAWRELGGFAPGYYAYLEDVDLCWRAWLAGHEVAYVPAAAARHAYGASGGGRLSPLRIRWMQRNRLANMARNLEARSWPGAALVSAAYDAYRVLEYGRHGQWAALRALAAGTLAFWRDLPGLARQRRQVQQARQVSDGMLRAMGLMAPALAAWREYRRLERVARG